MRAFAFLLVAVMLSACSAPQVVYKPVAVEKIVSVPCRIPAIAAPELPTAKAQKSATMFQKAKLVLMENEIRKGYEAQLVAASKACQ